MDNRDRVRYVYCVPAPVSALSLSESDKGQLQQWVAAFGTPQQVALRCRILLAAAGGKSDNAIAQELETNRKTVTLWRAPLSLQGLKRRLEGAFGRGGEPTTGPGTI